MGSIAFLIVALFLLYAQAFAGAVLPATPDLGPVLAVYIGLFVRRESVGLLAGALGVMRAALDLEPMGVSILTHLTLAVAVSVFRQILYAERLATQLVVTFAAGVFFVGMRMFGAVILPTEGMERVELFQRTVSVCFGTLLSPVIFFGLLFLRVGPLESAQRGVRP